MFCPTHFFTKKLQKSQELRFFTIFTISGPFVPLLRFFHIVVTAAEAEAVAEAAAAVFAFWPFWPFGGEADGDVSEGVNVVVVVWWFLKAVGP